MGKYSRTTVCLATVLLALGTPALGAASVLPDPADFYAHVQPAAADTALSAAIATRDWPRADALLREAVARRWQQGPPEENRDDAEAEAVLKGVFPIYQERVELGRVFDWNGRYGQGDKEFTWGLNRLFFLEKLWAAGVAKSDRRYQDRAVELMVDWVRANPRAQAETEAMWAAWRTLEIGLRLQKWSAMLGRLAASRYCPDDVLRRLLGSLWEQADFLAGKTGAGRGNWGLMETTGLGLAALRSPFFRESSAWLDLCWRSQAQDARDQIYPDGSQIELTPHYQITCLKSFLRLADLARAYGTPTPKDISGTVERMAGHLAAIAKPDLTIPMINDSDAFDVRTLLEEAAARHGREDFRYVASGERQGRPPAAESTLQTWSGLAVMRRGWGPEALYLCLDAGPFGNAHQHEDALGFDLMAFGQRLIADPGRYSYQPGPITTYLRETRAHNTITVDNSNQRRWLRKETWRPSAPPAVLPWISTERYDYAEAAYAQGYYAPTAGNVIHRRQVVFLKEPGIWVITDRVEGEGRHAVRLSYQFAPGDLSVRPDGSLTFQGDRAGLALRVIGPPAGVAPRLASGSQAPCEGWYSPIYGQAEAAPYVEWVAEADLPVVWHTVLVPHLGRQAPAVAARVEQDAPLMMHLQSDSLALELTVTPGPRPSVKYGSAPGKEQEDDQE